MLRVTIVWQDEHIVELSVRASNGQFAGETTVYTTYEELAKIAKNLRGFPRSGREEIAFSIAEPPGNELSISLSADATGHVCASVDVRSVELQGSASFPLCPQASQIDDFVCALEHMVEARGGRAVLGLDDGSEGAA
jgi:hypothetical protein